MNSLKDDLLAGGLPSRAEGSTQVPSGQGASAGLGQQQAQSGLALLRQQENPHLVQPGVAACVLLWVTLPLQPGWSHSLLLCPVCQHRMLCCPQLSSPWCVTLWSCTVTLGLGTLQAELLQLGKHKNLLLALHWDRAMVAWGTGAPLCLLCWVLPAPLPPAWGQAKSRQP